MRRGYVASQGGFTLIEVVITAAIGALLLGALVSVILTAMQATSTATNRVEASSQIRNFEYFAYEDFAAASVSDLGVGCTPSAPCSTRVNLSAIQAGNPAQTYEVSYTWDQTDQLLQRTVNSGQPIDAATNVSNFAWYIDSNQTVVLSLSVKVGTYTEAQTFRFYPRRNP